jgi:hypothetical protein
MTMTVTPERRAQASRENGRRSNGPSSDLGKLRSRMNSTRHGYTAEAVDLGPEYRALLARLIDEVRPSSEAEMGAVEEFARARVQLNRITLAQQAAAALRIAGRSDAPGPDGGPSPRQRARALGERLMAPLDLPRGVEEERTNEGHPIRVMTELLGFREGVEWVAERWLDLIPALRPHDPDEPLAASAATVARARSEAVRLLGARTRDELPEQPLDEAGEAELERMLSYLEGMASAPEERLRREALLFDASRQGELARRYEVAASNRLYKALNLLMRLRKDPELLPASPTPPPPLEPAPAPTPAPSPPARDRDPQPRVMPVPPLRNEPGAAERPATHPAPATAPGVPPGSGNGRH